MEPTEPEGKLSDPRSWTTTPTAKVVDEQASKRAGLPEQDEAEAKRRAARLRRLEGAVTPRGSGSGGGPRVDPRDVHYPLQPCDFKKWLRYDSLPIEQACFVLFGFEPPPLHVLRFSQDMMNPTREPTYDEPPDYSDALRSLRVSIQHRNVVALRVIELPYETKHVTWPELVRWAKAKGFTVPMEVEVIVAKMDQKTDDVRIHQADSNRAKSGASPPPEPEATTVVAGARDENEPRTSQTEPTESSQPNDAPTEVQPVWTVKQPKRFHSYTESLFVLIRDWNDRGKAMPPSNFDVLDIWREKLPPGVERVNDSDFDSNGKTVGKKALRQAIRRIAVRQEHA